MQIDSALSSIAPASGSRDDEQPVRIDRRHAAQTTTSATSATSAQDDAVHISAEGATAAAQDGNIAQDGTESDSAGESAPASGASAVKSFAYGTLGLERPDQHQEERNAFYTAGRWLAAGITVGGIVSLLLEEERELRLPCMAHGKRDRWIFSGRGTTSVDRRGSDASACAWPCFRSGESARA